MAVVLKKYINKKGKNTPYLYIDQNGYFWARKRIGDQTPRKKLDTKVETTAIQKLFQAVKELEDQIKLANTTVAEAEEARKKENAEKLFQDFWAKMMAEIKAEELRASTLRRIESVKRHSIEPSIFWNLKPAEINKDLGTKFINWHREKRVHADGTPLQLINVLKYLGRCLRMMLAEGVILPTQMPTLKLPKPEVRHHKAPKGRYIPQVEFDRIEKHFDARYKLLLHLGHDLGARKMELGKLLCSQVTKVDGRVVLDFSHMDTKTGIPRIIPVPPQYWDEILKAKKANKTYIFEAPTDSSRHVGEQYVHDLWTAAKKAAGIKVRTKFHDLRDTAATDMVKAGLNPVLIATFLGMSIKVLQEKYLKLKPEDLLIVTDAMINLRSKAAS